MNPFKPRKKSNLGNPKLKSSNPKRSKTCHWCGYQTARVRGTPKGWKFALGFGWGCPDCVEENKHIFEEKEKEK
jgi:hypothetical protein